jgi:hypothetical protein
MKIVFRLPWYKRLWNWLRGRKPGTLWRTHVFDEPVVVKNGDELHVTYRVKK